MLFICQGSAAVNSQQSDSAGQQSVPQPDFSNHDNQGDVTGHTQHWNNTQQPTTQAYFNQGTPYGQGYGGWGAPVAQQHTSQPAPITEAECNVGTTEAQTIHSNTENTNLNTIPSEASTITHVATNEGVLNGEVESNGWDVEDDLSIPDDLVSEPTVGSVDDNVAAHEPMVAGSPEVIPSTGLALSLDQPVQNIPGILKNKRKIS